MSEVKVYEVSLCTNEPSPFFKRSRNDLRPVFERKLVVLASDFDSQSLTMRQMAEEIRLLREPILERIKYDVANSLRGTRDYSPSVIEREVQNRLSKLNQEIEAAKGKIK